MNILILRISEQVVERLMDMYLVFHFIKRLVDVQNTFLQ